MGLVRTDGNRSSMERLKKGGVILLQKGLYIEATGENLTRELRRHWAALTGAVAPDGVITDRTAMEGKPSIGEDGTAHIYVSAPRSPTAAKFPGLIIHVRRGPGPVECDTVLLGMPFAGLARRLLDNLSPSRARLGLARTVGREGVEVALETALTLNGPSYLRGIQREAARIAPLIDRESEMSLLDEVVGGLLNTRDTVMTSSVGKARTAGKPYDPKFLEMFEEFTARLEVMGNPEVADPETDDSSFNNACFIEAYFSNYIEGTRFFIGEAREIVLEGRGTSRVKDGHDISATYGLLLHQPRRPITDLSSSEFIDLLTRDHARLMAARPEDRPGLIKERNNRVGTHVFVAPDLVRGTLEGAWPRLRTIRDPFPRALALHYLISGVHPFTDGNGRMSRLMMTGELRAAGLCRVVVPTIGRNEYLTGLRNVSQRADPTTFFLTMKRFQEVTVACVNPDLDTALRAWASAYAFCEDDKRANLSSPDLTRPLRDDGEMMAPEEYWDEPEAFFL